jgi:hypothetical protein
MHKLLSKKMFYLTCLISFHFYSASGMTTIANKIKNLFKITTIRRFSLAGKISSPQPLAFNNRRLLTSTSCLNLHNFPATHYYDHPIEVVNIPELKTPKNEPILFNVAIKSNPQILNEFIESLETQLLILIKAKPQFYTTYYPSEKLDINPCCNPNASSCYLENKEYLINVILSNKHLAQERLGKLVLYHSVCENDYKETLILLLLGANPNATINLDDENCTTISSSAITPLMQHILKKYGGDIL